MSEISTSSINQAGLSTDGAIGTSQQHQHDPDHDLSRASQLALLDELAAADDADVDSLHDNSDPSAAFKAARQNLVRLPSGKGGKDKHGDPNTASVGLFVCAGCGTHLALQDEVISKAFSGRDGKAYLFHSSINTLIGRPEDRQLLTGLHTVADVRCAGCERLVGWTYLKAWEGAQKYKEGECMLAASEEAPNVRRGEGLQADAGAQPYSGRFIMERAAIHKVNNWS